MKVYCIFDKHLDHHIKRMIKQWSYKTRELDLWEKPYSSEDFFQLFGLDPKQTVDCTNGCWEAYESLILDIKEIDPDFLIVPFGSGETFFGLIQGIKKYKLKSKLIGVTPFKKNKSLADKLSCFFSPYESSIKKVKNKRIKILRVSEKAIQKAMAIGEKETNCEASSAIVFAVLNKIKFSKEAKVVFINTGRRKYLQ